MAHSQLKYKARETVSDSSATSVSEQIGKLETEQLVIKDIDPIGFIFDERAKLKCFYCAKYGRNLRCPPNIPDVDYPKMLLSRDEARLFCYRQPFAGVITSMEREQSSHALHKAILVAEGILWQNNYPLAISFIGGSCKLCGLECTSQTCLHPHQSRIMLEAIGVDISRTAENVGIEIVYPPHEHFWRVGAVLW